MLTATPALGRTYYLVFPKNLDLYEVKKTIFNLKSNLKKDQKIRIIWDGNEKRQTIFESLEILKQESFPSLSIQDYDTVFYCLENTEIENQLQKYPETNIKNYPNLKYKKVEFQDENYETTKDFFLNSNGVIFSKKDNQTVITPDPDMQIQILSQIETAFKNPNNQTFLVYFEDEKVEYVGAFSLLLVNPNEVQLHYTSGKSSLTNIYKGKKLPLLAASILDILANNSDYKNIDMLTFTNKDKIVSKAYQDVGFRPFEGRNCVIVKNNLQKYDVV
jgi:hypothetical protein